MSKLWLQKVVTALVIAVLLSSSVTTLVNAASPAAPTLQQLRTKTIAGSIKGGEFAKYWLGLEPEQSGAVVTVVAEWDRANATENGVGFFILDEEGLKRVGESTLSSIAVAAGNSSFFLNGASNVQGASFNAIGLAKYTLVIYNDSNSGASFKITATNGFITDDSGQVTDPNASTTPAASTESSAATTSTAITTTATTTTTAAPAAAVATPAPVATVAPQPVQAVRISGPVSATTMEGDLPTLDSQHFLGLTPSERDGQITLQLTFDPQDSSELARRLNFWVLDSAGFKQFQAGSSLSEVAIAAGNRTFQGDNNERVANFKSVNLGPYTVIVENKSRVPASYQLTVQGGLLLDDSGQTKTAQQSTGLSATTGVTGTAASTTQTTTAPATTASNTTTTTTASTTTAAAAGTGAAGTPGGTYTVKSGDSLSTIARDIYGDLQLYRGICTFNGIANCDVIEVGDVINLPTLAQLQSGATAPATTAARATPTPATTVARPATSTAVTTTSAVTTTPAVSVTADVTTTTAVTRATTASPTRAVTTTNASTATTTSTVGDANLVDLLTADGRFTSLVRALQATGLDKVLKGRGPFTVFAPTDAAFAGLPNGAFEQLLADPGGQLKDILLYHVVSSKTMAADISNNLQATTVQGKPVKFTVNNGAVRINSAGIIESDTEASNGVIHAIDTVILPPPK